MRMSLACCELRSASSSGVNFSQSGSVTWLTRRGVSLTISFQAHVGKFAFHGFEFLERIFGGKGTDIVVGFFRQQGSNASAAGLGSVGFDAEHVHGDFILPLFSVARASLGTFDPVPVS